MLQFAVCRSCALAVTLVGLSTQIPGQDAPCAAVLPSQARQPAYARATNPTRCEGFFDRNVSQPFIEVVSLTRAAPGTLTPDSQGLLNFSGLPRLDLNLTIQPLRSTPLYRVDAQLARGAVLAWNSSPMLQATALKPRDLGLLALADGPAEPPALAPVSVAGAEENAALAYAVLRPSVAVSALAWRAYRIGSAPGTWAPIAGPPLFAWERIVLPIPLPGDGGGQRIDVRALDGQGQPLPLLQFVLLGVNDGKP
jgi:hypothetical protein